MFGLGLGFGLGFGFIFIELFESRVLLDDLR